MKWRPVKEHILLVPIIDVTKFGCLCLICDSREVQEYLIYLLLSKVISTTPNYT